jgi:hypothetical protein
MRINMDKYAALTSRSAKIDKTILEHIGQCVNLKSYVENLLLNPTEDNIKEVQDFFNDAVNGMVAVGNSISTFIKTVQSDDGSVEEVDVLEDEDGVRLM